MIRVLGETFEQPEELSAYLGELEHRLADTPENPVGPRRELEARLAVLRAVERRLRRERRLRSYAAVGAGAGALLLALRKSSRHTRYVAAIAVVAFVGLLVAYWYVAVLVAALAVVYLVRRRRAHA